MSNPLTGLHRFHKTRRGFIVFGLIEAVLFYIMASIAIDTANMFAYTAAIILFIGAIINVVNAVDYKRLQALGANRKRNGKAKN